MIRSMRRLGPPLACGLAMLPAGAAWADGTPSWESVPPMITPRGEHTATVLQDGRVLVAGGYPEVDQVGPYTDENTAVSLRAAEIYDPATRTWSPAAPLSQARSGHAAILLPNGHVLVAGGRARSRWTFGQEHSSAEIYDPASDTWTAVGRLPVPHPTPSMMLAGGRPVLVGMAYSAVDAIDWMHAAVYDPESRDWTTVPSCDAYSRLTPISATLLHDGRVMAVGSGCSLHDLETGLWTWEQGAVLGTRQYKYPDATTLPGGGVLVVGGTLAGPDPEIHAFSQIYLPQEDRWEPTPGPYAPASTPCGLNGSSIRGARTSLLPSGKVLLTGGLESCQPKDDWTEYIVPFYATMALFDEATRAWSSLDVEPPVTMARAYHSSTRLRDGSVLIAGGYIGATTPTASAMLFHERAQLGAGCAADSDCGSGFCADSVCCDARCAGPCDACAAASGAPQDGVCTPLTGVACDDADACIAGGVCEAGACVGGEAAPDGTPCSDGDVCSAASACVGGACVGSSLATCLPADDCHEAPACDPAAGCAAPAPAMPDGTPCDFPGTEDGWRETGRMDTFLSGNQATVLQDGTVLVIGSGRVPSRSEPEPLWTRYDPSTGAWQPARPVGFQSAQTPTLLPDGTVLVIGPRLSVSPGPVTTWRFDPATGVWTPAAATVASRSGHTATLLQDGRVLLAGGDQSGGYGGVQVEVYDPVNDAWTARAPLNVPRLRHSATLLPDGRVLVAGGSDGGSLLASAEVYDPAADTWTPAASMGWGRTEHTATLLPDGRVLVAGSVGEETGKTAEIYDPSSDTWTSAGEMATARQSQGAMLLSDGRVLVTGNSQTSDNGTLAAELYDPASSTWAPAPALDVMINSHATALLDDGRVLVAGGRAGRWKYNVTVGHQSITNAWLYVPALPASGGACQAGACVPGEGGGHGGAGGDGGGGHGGHGGAGGDATGSGSTASGGGGDASGGGGIATGSGGDPAGGGVTTSGGHGGSPSSSSGGGTSSSSEVGAGGSATGGHGGEASNEGGAPSTTTVTTGAGSDASASNGASTTGAQSSGGGDQPSAGGGGGCHMAPGSQPAAPWLLALGALASTRLRRRSARIPRST
ncbi:Kelch repeat-containing protein [Sorangium sp. So ce1099]|uniref:Kelch repeat-containing protein n=1 Tax=Sorangium sp. So ce1099 TaxID=3133331 RepID=UPI003F609E65